MSDERKSSEELEPLVPHDEHFPQAFLAGLAGMLLTQLSLAGVNRMLPGDVPLAFKLLLNLIPLFPVGIGLALLILWQDIRQYGFRILDQPHLPKWQALKLHLALSVVAFIGVNSLNAVSAFVLHLFGMDDLPEQLPELQFHAREIPVILSCLINAVLVVPVCEELLFRVLCPVFFIRLRIPRPELCAAILFACLHGLPQGVLGLTFLGVLLYYAYRRGGLLQAVLLHATYNLVTLAVMLCSHGL